MVDGLPKQEGVYRTARKILDGEVYVPYSRIYDK